MGNLETRLALAVDKALDAGVGAGRPVVGAVVRVTIDGETTYSRAAGFADREAGKRLNEDAIFRLASMSKAMVAATALAMVDRGKLSLNDKVARFLPDFRPRLADGSTPDILIRHLLNHTSGLTYGFVQKPGHAYHRANVSDGLDQPGLSMEENLRRIASVPLEFAPGTAWGYSVSFDVLGAVITSARGTTLGEAVAEYVTGPLGLPDTGFHIADAARLAPPYADGKPQPVRMADTQRVPRPDDPDTALILSPSRVFNERSFESGGAGMNGTAADYTKFVEALRLEGSPILKAETVAMASRNQIGTLPREPKDAGLRTSFFAGVVDNPVAAQTPQSAGSLQFGGAWGHTGFLDHPRRLSVVCLTNTAVEGVAGTFPITIRDAIYSSLAA